MTKTEKDSIEQLSQTYPYTNIYFPDPAIIPVSHWNVLDLKSGKVITEVDYDNNGNAIKVIEYNKAGKKDYEFTFPSCNKRKIVKLNDDGSFYGEFCENTMADFRKQ